ncbi:MAG TPA: hypothetical protein VHF26_13370, partial [Trebonia sp.]|nr:hypothetical protein [Trebonia sp.]
MPAGHQAGRGCGLRYARWLSGTGRRGGGGQGRLPLAFAGGPGAAGPEYAAGAEPAELRHGPAD